MVQVVYSPQWFYGKDIIIDVVSVLVLFLIGTFSLSSYRTLKKKTYLCLSIAFYLLSLAFIFKILTNFTIYYNVIKLHEIPEGILRLQYLQSSDILFIVGFLLYRLLTLFGLYLLYVTYQKNLTWKDVAIVLYLILISTYFTHSTMFVFHLTTFILLLFITAGYTKHYRDNKISTTGLLALSFGIITLSQVLFLFVHIDLNLYVFAEVIQLLGYVALLATFIQVLQHGKKTKQG